MSVNSLGSFLTQPTAVQGVQVLRSLDVDSAVNSCVGACSSGAEKATTSSPGASSGGRSYAHRLRRVWWVHVSLQLGTFCKDEMHSLGRWLEAAAVFAKAAFDFSITEACAGLSDVTNEVDASCTKWGQRGERQGVANGYGRADVVAESEHLLVAGVDELFVANNLESWGRCAYLPPMEYKGARQCLQLASNSLHFGKDTIKFAAACTVVIERSTNEVATVMKHESVFPTAFVGKLMSVSGDAEQASASPRMSSAWGLKRKASSFR